MSSFTPVSEERPAATDAAPVANQGGTSSDTPIASSQPLAQTNTLHQGYTLQVAAVKSAQQADTLLKKLTDLGYSAYTVQNKNGTDVWYRLRVGVFGRPEDAKKLMERLRDEQFNPILIKF